MTNKPDILEEIVRTHQAKEIVIGSKRILLDSLTAIAILTTYQSLNIKEAYKFINMDWERIIAIQEDN